MFHSAKVCVLANEFGGEEWVLLEAAGDDLGMDCNEDLWTDAML